MVPLCSLYPYEELSRGVWPAMIPFICVFSPKVMRSAEKRVVFVIICPGFFQSWEHCCSFHLDNIDRCADTVLQGLRFSQ